MRDAEYYGQLSTSRASTTCCCAGHRREPDARGPRQRRTDGRRRVLLRPREHGAGRLLDQGRGPAAQDPAVAGHPRRSASPCRCSARRSIRPPWWQAVAVRSRRRAGGGGSGRGGDHRTTGSGSCWPGPGARGPSQPVRWRPAHGAGDRRDAEELGLLQSRHEGVILGTDAGDQGGPGRRRPGEPRRAAGERDCGAQPAGALPAAARPGAEPAGAGADRDDDLRRRSRSELAAALKLASGIAHAFPQSSLGPCSSRVSRRVASRRATPWASSPSSPDARSARA